jgi:hypothetical protein
MTSTVAVEAIVADDAGTWEGGSGATDRVESAESAGEGARATGLSNSCKKSSSQVRGVDVDVDIGVLDSAAVVLKTSLLKYSITRIAHGEPLNKRSK